MLSRAERFPGRNLHALILSRIHSYAFPPLSPRAAAYAPLLLCCILSYHYKIISSPRRRPEAVLLECVSCALTTGPRRNIIHYSIPPRPAYTRIFVPNFSFNKPFPSAVFFFAPLSASTFHALTKQHLPFEQTPARREKDEGGARLFDKHAKCFEFYIKRFLCRDEFSSFSPLGAS